MDARKLSNFMVIKSFSDNEKFISIDIYCNELTDYLRKYFKVESIME